MHNNVRDATAVLKDGIKKPKYPIASQRRSMFHIRRMWMRYGLVPCLAFLVILATVFIHPFHSSAAESLDETSVPPSPTPMQVTPPPRGTVTSLSSPPEVNGESQGTARQLTQTPNWWLLPTAGGIIVGVVVGITLLVLVVLLFLYTRRRQHPTLGPLQISSVPFLKSADGSLYFRLDGLGEDGLIIGRGKHGVDLRVEETTPNVDTVSNQHARIYYNATYGKVIIEDLHSTNGIFINGRQAPHKNLLKDGWVVGLGSVTLIYHDGESDTGPLD